MYIEISSDQFEKLTRKAHAAGYPDVTAFIVALAGERTEDPRGSLTEEQLRQSVAELEAADASIDASGGRDAREAFLEIGEEFGFKLPE